MKVNEEVDALTTMGIDPDEHAGAAASGRGGGGDAGMALVLDISGLVGMAVVMRGFGYPLAILENQVQTWTTPSDLIGVWRRQRCSGGDRGSVGCRSGLSTGSRAAGGGSSATAAVVGGIVATIVLDGIFAVFFNRLRLVMARPG